MSQGHIDTLSTFKLYKPFGDATKLFKANVVSNEDTRLLGRIKCSTPDLIPWDDKDKLPWIYPLYPAGLGEGPLSSHFAVPEEDSEVIIFSGSQSIYHMFYAWHSTDRLNRMQDFHSEYPHRYGWQDSVENKKIINTHEDVNTIEHRMSDGTVSIHDSKNETTMYMDIHGTHVYIDRKNQKMKVQFADQAVDITPSGVVLTAKKVVISGDEGVIINSKKGIVLNTPYVTSGGRIIGRLEDNTEPEQ